MATGFNYEDFYMETTAKAEVAIDRSGVEVENPSEVNEYVTDNVKYYVSGIAFKRADGSTGGLGPYGRIVATTTDTKTIYLTIWEPLEPAVSADLVNNWDPGVNRESLVTLSDERAVYYYIVDYPTPSFEVVTNVSAAIFPRYEAESNNGMTVAARIGTGATTTGISQDTVSATSFQYSGGDANLPRYMRAMYAALGFYGGRGKKASWLDPTTKSGMRKTNVNAVIKYDTFVKRMDAVAEECAASGMGFAVKYYDTTYSEDGTSGTEADITRTGMKTTTSFDEAYNVHLPAFLNGEKTVPLVNHVGSAYGNTTALIPPMRDVVAAFYYPTDEMEAEFHSLFKEVYDGLDSVPEAVWDKVSATDRAKYKSIAMLFGEVSVPASDASTGTAGAGAVNDPGIGIEYIYNYAEHYYKKLSEENNIWYPVNVNTTWVTTGVTMDMDASEVKLIIDDAFNMIVEHMPDRNTQGTKDSLYKYVARGMNIARMQGYAVQGTHPSGNESELQVSEEIEGTYKVVSFSKASTSSNIIPTTEFVRGEKSTMKELSAEDLRGAGILVDAARTLHKIYRRMRNSIISDILTLGPSVAIRATERLDDIEDAHDDLMTTVNRMYWYQRLVHASPFANLSLLPDDRDYETVYPTWTLPGRLFFPVHMYKKVRVKYKKWFRTRHKTVKRSIGVRWAEVTFYDTSVYAEYPQVTETPGEYLDLTGYVGEAMTVTESDQVYYLMKMSKSLPERVLSAKTGTLYIADTSVDFEVYNDLTLKFDMALVPGQYAGLTMKLPLEKSQGDGTKESVTVRFNMPGLPYDEEIRKKSFIDYGSLSSETLFEKVRNGDEPDDAKPGWTVFHETSGSIEDMRDGIGIRDKVAMLLAILRNSFGNNRVTLVGTYRSAADQATVCAGGPESEFLSWHNYGLAAKILIYKADGKTPMEKGDPDFAVLRDIAKAFTDACYRGLIGSPCNLVWCARLAVGPSIFDWEFLPIGVGHKDAPRFRDLVMAQMDPVKELSYIDVDAAGYTSNSPDSGLPYVDDGSLAYQSALTVARHKYMPASLVRNYVPTTDIVLRDVKEFIDLVKLKMDANGTSLPPSGSIYDWKALNGPSYIQLVRYYAITGSIASAKSLIAGDYVETYLNYEEMYYSRDRVAYVKGMLGRHYATAGITIDNDDDSSWITLSDGILHIKSLDAFPLGTPVRAEMHKQNVVGLPQIVRGSWHNGIFYTLDERPIPEITSDGPVIDGYIEGVPTEGDALYLHEVVAAKIHTEFEKIRARFENFQGKLMYDRMEYGPNAGMEDMLENEFGLIKAQDLLTFEQLEQVTAPEINELVDGSIYEKVVDNAQAAGIRMASLTKEHIHVRDRAPGKTAQRLYEILQKGRGYTANDLLR